MNSPYSKYPIYGNYQVKSPEGILMFRCDERKANWYLSRDLAEVISKEPLTIKLKFKPKGLGNHDKTFGLTEMKNICVNCGKTSELNRHHVVPYCYRKYFPLKLKSHNFHDVLSLCVGCHEKYERQADKLKEFLSIEHNAPINGETIDNKELMKYSKMAMTLIKEDINQIPRKRVNHLKNSIKSHFGIKRLTKKKLEEISGIKATIINRTHGEIVISKISDIQSFVEMWRNHFVENNSCQYLPKDWSIKTRIEHNV